MSERGLRSTVMIIEAQEQRAMFPRTERRYPFNMAHDDNPITNANDDHKFSGDRMDIIVIVLAMVAGLGLSVLLRLLHVLFLPVPFIPP